MSSTPPQPVTDPALKVYRSHRDVSFTNFDPETLVVVPRDAWQMVLNESGGKVLALIDGKRTVREIAQELGRSYPDQGADELTRDVLELIDDLLGKGAIEAVSAT